MTVNPVESNINKIASTYNDIIHALVVNNVELYTHNLYEAYYRSVSALQYKHVIHYQKGNNNPQ